MTRRFIALVRLLPLAVCLLACGVVAVSQAQHRPVRIAASSPRRKSERRRSQTGKQQTPQPPIQFGDVDISAFANLDVDLGAGVARVSGPNTTVDARDPRQPEAKSRLQARQITVYLFPKSNEQVDRIEAVGNLRFTGSRPGAGGVQTARATGTRGVYYKQEGRITIEGPVTFFGEGPSADGKSRQSINGTSERATYNENTGVLTLSGNVRATLTIPDTLKQPANVMGDEVVVETAKRPYVYHIHNTNPEHGSVEIEPKQPAPKQPDQKKP